MIDSFSGTHRFLSNFWLCPVNYKGIEFRSVENAYQASKCVCPIMWWDFLTLSPGQAKRFGCKIPIRHDWEAIKVGVMRDLIRRKFQDPELIAMLLCTGDEELIEGNNWGDVWWGVCNGKGENWLGRILMEVREDLRKELNSKI